MHKQYIFILGEKKHLSLSLSPSHVGLGKVFLREKVNRYLYYSPPSLADLGSRQLDLINATKHGH